MEEERITKQKAWEDELKKELEMIKMTRKKSQINKWYYNLKY